jgi:hypothetical protein
LLDSLQHLENLLHQNRQAQMQLSREEKVARGKLADAIQLWQTGGTKLTPEENTRQFLAAQVEERRQRAEARQAMGMPNGPGPSVIDVHGRYAFKGDGSDFARKTMTRGFRRGGFTKTQAAQVNAQRMRKLPSER